MSNSNVSILKREYWRDALYCCRDLKMIVIAALITALRIAVKSIDIPILDSVQITFGCYVNAVGSFIYGPVMAIFASIVSDTVGAILFPNGTYFLPFILVEIAGSFIFALFLWRRPFSIYRTVLSKFTVSLVCNIFMTSLFMKWYYIFFGIESSYALINLVRIVKNLVMFPLEGILISAVLLAVIPALKANHLLSSQQTVQKITARHILFVIMLLLLSIALVLFYIFFLKDFISANNIKLF